MLKLSKKYIDSRSAFTVVLTIFVVYAAVFIAQTSFIIDGKRYFCLFDDAMISMRYARNLAEGIGLVWNRGEYIEGFTNLIWTLYMALVHLTGVPEQLTSLVVQISSAVCLLINLFVVRNIVRAIPGTNEWIALTAVVLTAFYYPLVNWSLQGMEVGILTLLVDLTVLLYLRQLRNGNYKWYVYCPIMIAVCIRIDMVLLFSSMIIFDMITNARNRKIHLVYGVGMMLVAILLQTIFRYVYYKELLPNTYYLKMNGFSIISRFIRGLLVFGRFTLWLNCVLVIVISYTVKIKNRCIFFLIIPFIVQSAYSVYVGGDAWERWGGCNRFISIAMPTFFIIAACGISLFSQKIFNKFNFIVHKKVTLWHIYTLMTFASLVQVNMYYGPKALLHLVQLRPPLYTEINRDMVHLARKIESITNKNDTVAVVCAGVLPYFCDRYMVDMLGKTDRVTARIPMRRISYGWIADRLFFPGHMKWDYHYILEVKKPHIIIGFWQGIEEIKELLYQNYDLCTLDKFTVYKRRDMVPGDSLGK